MQKNYTFLQHPIAKNGEILFQIFLFFEGFIIVASMVVLKLEMFYSLFRTFLQLTAFYVMHLFTILQ